MHDPLPDAESTPNWDRLFDFALGQDGHFTTKQAAEAGYSSQLLIKHINGGRIIRGMRGVYRLVHFPAGEHEELTMLWLWAERAGVFSHETALHLSQSGSYPFGSVIRIWRTTS